MNNKLALYQLFHICMFLAISNKCILSLSFSTWLLRAFVTAHWQNRNRKGYWPQDLEQHTVSLSLKNLMMCSLWDQLSFSTTSFHFIRYLRDQSNMILWGNARYFRVWIVDILHKTGLFSSSVNINCCHKEWDKNGWHCLALSWTDGSMNI